MLNRFIQTRGRLLLWYLSLEFSLVALALVGSHYLGPTRLFAYTFKTSHLLSSLVWMILPILLGLFLTLKRSAEYPFLKEILSLLRNSQFGDFLKNGTWIQLLLLAMAAGIGEETFFRGFMQSHFGNFSTSLFFGTLHFITFPYFLLATIMSYYLGLSYELNQTLLVPILIHGIYDFVALMRIKTLFQIPTQIPSVESASNPVV